MSHTLFDPMFDSLDIRRATGLPAEAIRPYTVAIKRTGREAQVCLPTKLYPLIGQWAEDSGYDPEFELHPEGKGLRLWAIFGDKWYPLVDYSDMPQWAKEAK